MPDKICALKDCEKSFTPYQGGKKQLYCTTAHADLARKRNQRRTKKAMDPRERERLEDQKFARRQIEELEAKTEGRIPNTHEINAKGTDCTCCDLEFKKWPLGQPNELDDEELRYLDRMRALAEGRPHHLFGCQGWENPVYPCCGSKPTTEGEEAVGT